MGELLERSDRDVYGDNPYSEENDGIEISEIFQHEELATLETRMIANADIVPWLNQNPNAANGNNKGRRTMRIVLIPHEFQDLAWQYKIVKSNYELIVERFELKRARQLMPHEGIICLPAEYRRDPIKESFALNSEGRNLQVMWTYDLITNSTEVMCFADPKYIPLLLVRDVLESQKRLARHPMFMVFVCAIIQSYLILRALPFISFEITKVENRTRHSPGERLSFDIAAGSYASLSAVMSGWSLELAYWETQIALLREILDALPRYQSPQGAAQPEWAQQIVKEIDECAVILRQRSEDQGRWLRFLSRRADIQLTAVGHNSNLSAA